MTRVTYVGHATVLVAMDGTRLLTDPLLRWRVGHLRRRTKVEPDSRRVDAVLLSHAHYDHLDLPSLERLGRSTPLIVPRGIAALVRRWGFEHVQEIGVGERVGIGQVTVEATYADHAGGRPPRRLEASALGYVFEGSHRVYFAGDTDLFPEMASLAGGLDLAMLPIWGWGAKLGRGKHLDPERAAEALALLRPRIAVPIHWGTYHPFHLGVRGAPGFLRAPAERFARAAAEAAPEVEVRVLEPGASLDL